MEHAFYINKLVIFCILSWVLYFPMSHNISSSTVGVQIFSTDPKSVLAVCEWVPSPDMPHDSVEAQATPLYLTQINPLSLTISSIILFLHRPWQLWETKGNHGMVREPIPCFMSRFYIIGLHNMLELFISLLSYKNTILKNFKI